MDTRISIGARPRYILGPHCFRKPVALHPGVSLPLKNEKKESDHTGGTQHSRQSGEADAGVPSNAKGDGAGG